MPFTLLTLFFALGCAAARGPASYDSGRLEVSPGQTGGNIAMITSPHVAYWNPLFSNGKLLITIGGTESRSTDFADFSEVAVKMGYAVVGVDYPNSVITTTCRDSQHISCFDDFREEICEGEPVSELVRVDQENSIQRRIQSLLKFLASRDLRWRQFLGGDEVIWSKVVLAGHSQGSGHAAYLGKELSVHRVIMIAGPQDHFTDRPAPWLKKEGATPADRYFALLHKDDFFDSQIQLKVFKELCRCQDLRRVLVSARPAEDPHNVLMTPEYREEWAALLRADP